MPLDPPELLLPILLVVELAGDLVHGEETFCSIRCSPANWPMRLTGGCKLFKQYGSALLQCPEPALRKGTREKLNNLRVCLIHSVLYFTIKRSCSEVR